MKDKIFKSITISVSILALIIFSSIIYMFLQYEMNSVSDKQWELVFSIQSIIPFFIGIIVYITAILLDINISNSVIYVNPDGLRNPIFTALSMLPLCTIIVFLIVNGNDFAVAPGFGWISALITHINIYDLNMLS